MPSAEDRGNIEMPPLIPEVAEPPVEVDSGEPNEAEPIEEAQASAPEAFESKDKINFREMRKAKERAERERDELRETVSQLKQIKESLAPTASKDSDEEEISLRPDDIPEWRHVNKYIQKLEKRIEQYEKQSTLSQTESRLKNQYSDFDSVVNAENVKELASKYPEVAASIHSNNDVYSKAVAAYTMIKRLGIGGSDEYAPDREKALKNASKPRPLASVSPQQGESPLTRANAFAEGLTDSLKEQLRKEMSEAIKYR